ncbi:hypothetical protein [Aestuariirhabdus litorea]|nr:hypothetical protein [Aestuariirhabdus litorea]
MPTITFTANNGFEIEKKAWDDPALPLACQPTLRDEEVKISY